MTLWPAALLRLLVGLVTGGAWPWVLAVVAAIALLVWLMGSPR
jgi:hypothetical protein